MSKPLLAALAALSLAACGEAESAPPKAPETLPVEQLVSVSHADTLSRLRLESFIATPEDVPGLEGCIRAALATDSERTLERIGAVEDACMAEAPNARTDDCRRWAQAAAKIGYKFRSFIAGGSSNVGLMMVQEAQKDDEPAAVACNASLKQPGAPNTLSTGG